MNALVTSLALCSVRLGKWPRRRSGLMMVMLAASLACLTLLARSSQSALCADADGSGRHSDDRCGNGNTRSDQSAPASSDLPLLVRHAKQRATGESSQLPQWDAVKNASSQGKIATSNGQMKYILYWNEFYGRMDFNWGLGQTPFQTANCSVSNCFGTDNHSLMPIEQFDAILFHMQTSYKWPLRRSKHQHYVFVTREAPAYLFNPLTRFHSYFNLTMTYRRSSDFPIPYGKVTRAAVESGAGSSSGGTPVNYASGKDRLAAWFVSNCRSRSGREHYVRKLRRHISVDVYGDCGSFKCARDEQLSCHDRLLNNNYKFYLAFENSICDEYVTEKFYQALLYNVVPVVMGGADYSGLAPPNSYIDALQYSPRELAAYLQQLDRNDTMYNTFFAWKGKYSVIGGDGYFRDAFCDLCKYLNGPKKQKIYHDIRRWWISGKCRMPLL